MDVELQSLNDIAKSLQTLSPELILSFVKEFLNETSVSDWATRIFRASANSTVVEHSYLLGLDKSCPLDKVTSVLEKILKFFYFFIEWSFDVGDVRGYKINFNPSKSNSLTLANKALLLALHEHRKILFRFLSALPCVKYIADDPYLKHHSTFANAPTCIQPPSQAGFFKPSLELWGLDEIDGVVDSRFSFQMTGLGVTIYILDSGVNARHNDFGGRASVIYTAASVANIPVSDCSGHGTHVAGVAAGLHTGVAKGATINSLRIIGCGEVASVSDVVAALSHLNGVLKRPAVINMSLGSADAEDIGPTLPGIMQAFAQANVPMVVSAGNAGKNICQSSQSLTTVPKTIVVGALAQDLKPTTFSNYGPCVRYWAPGMQIWSTSHIGYSDYRSLDGTSQAAPFVTGIVASILERFPDATVDRVMEILTASSKSFSGNYFRISAPVLLDGGPTASASSFKYPYASCPSLFAIGGVLFWALMSLVAITIVLCISCIVVALCIRRKRRRQIYTTDAKMAKPNVAIAGASQSAAFLSPMLSSTEFGFGVPVYAGNDRPGPPGGTSIVKNAEPATLRAAPFSSGYRNSVSTQHTPGMLNEDRYFKHESLLATNPNEDFVQSDERGRAGATAGNLPAIIAKKTLPALPEPQRSRAPNALRSPILEEADDNDEMMPDDVPAPHITLESSILPDRLNSPAFFPENGPSLLLPQLPQVVRNRRSTQRRLQSEPET